MFKLSPYDAGVSLFRTAPLMPTTDDRFLTVREVAALMRVSTMTVYRLIKAGDLAATRVGRSYRLREREIDAYLGRQL
jgi:excisionase family DNA binding protein